MVARLPLIAGFVLLMAVLLMGAALMSPVGGNDTPLPQGERKDADGVREDRPLYPVEIRKPAGPPTIDSGLRDAAGHSIPIGCGTCHATRPANVSTRQTSDLDEFHQGLQVQHGNLSCVSCHHPATGYQTLRLADGRDLPYTEVMQLCAQCHGPQFRDYTHGSHGGMNGYWDRTRGPRRRNNCIDCHNPHAPRYPQVMPAPGPRDRFLPREDKGHE